MKGLILTLALAACGPIAGEALLVASPGQALLTIGTALIAAHLFRRFLKQPRNHGVQSDGCRSVPSFHNNGDRM